MSTAIAAPTGGSVAAGSASISQSGSVTDIHQTSHHAAIDWNSFDVTQAETVNFHQPSSTSSTLNRVNSGSASIINGKINANGRVFLINGSGVIFSKDAVVNAASFMASTLDIDNDDFMANQYHFNHTGSSGRIVNQGLIQAATGGSVTLVGDTVSNEGVIVADLGTVTLASGKTATLDFDGDNLISFAVDGNILSNNGQSIGVNNSGEITGGSILLTSKSAAGVFDYAVNNEGVLNANSAITQGGEIHLIAEDATVIHSGIIEAKGLEGAAGGEVHLLGKNVGLFGEGSVDVSGDSGGGTVLVGGEYQGQGDIHTAEYNFMGANATIKANALDFGDGGRVILWANNRTQFYGSIEARAGPNGGNGGFVETSGKAILQSFGTVDARSFLGEAGLWLLDPYNITIVEGNDPDTGTTQDPLNTFTSTATGAEVSVEQINTALSSGTDVTIKTGTSVFSGQPGDITINADIEHSGGDGTNSTLILEADGQIKFGDEGLSRSISDARDQSGQLSVEFKAGKGIDTSDATNFDIQGSAEFTVTGSGDITIGSALTADGGAIVEAQNGAINISEFVALSLGADSSFTSSGIFEIASNAALTNTNHNLTINAADLDLAGNISVGSGTVTLTQASGGAISLGGTADMNISTSELGNILAGTVNIGDGDESSIAVESAISQNYSIGLNASTVTLGAGITTVGENQSITVTGQTIIDASTVNINTFGGDISIASGNTLSANGISQSLDLNSGSPVGFSLPSSGGNITLGQLTNTGGQHIDNVTLGAAGTSSEGSITLDGAGANTVSGDVNIIGAAFILNNDLSSSTGNISITSTAASTLSHNISANSSAGVLTLSGSGGITLGADVTLTAGNLALSNTIDTGSNTLTLAPFTSGEIFLGDNLTPGSGFHLDQAELNSITGASGPLVLGNLSAGDITLGDFTADSGIAKNVDMITGGNITVQQDATFDLAQANTVDFTTGTSGILSLEAGSGNTTTLVTGGATSITAEDIQLNANTTLNVGSGNILTILSADGSSGSFVLGSEEASEHSIALSNDELGRITADTLILGRADQLNDVDITADIDLGYHLTVLAPGASTMTLGGNINSLNAGDSVTVSEATLNITGDRSITTNSGGVSLDAVTTNSDGNHTLTVATGSGSITFDDNIGVNDTGELAGLTLASGGTVLFSGSDATVDVNTLTIGSSTAVGSVEFDGAVNVDGNIDINTGTFQNDAMITTGGSGTFELSATGDAHINQGITSAGAMTFDGTGTINLGADLAITGAGAALDINSATLRLSGDRNLTTNNGNITLDEVNTDSSGSHILTLTAGTGSITFNDNIGVNDTGELAGLNIQTGGAVHFSGTDATIDVADLNIGLSSAVSSVEFDGVVRTAGGIDINTGTFQNDAVITTEGSGIFRLTNTGTATINSDITSAGAMTFDGAGTINLGANLQTTEESSILNIGDAILRLTGNSTLTTNNGNITLDEVNTSLHSNHTLTLTAGSGDIIVDDNIGVNETGELAGLNIQTGGTVHFSGSDATIDVTDLTIGSSAAVGSVEFDGAVNTGGNIDINTGIFRNDAVITAGGSGIFRLTNTGTATINSDISSAGAMTFDSTGAINLSADLSSEGVLSVAPDVAVSGSRSVSTSDDNITFEGNIDGTGSLTANAGAADLVVEGVIGSSTELSSIDFDARDITLNSIGDSDNTGVSGNTNIDATRNLTLTGDTYKTNAAHYSSGSGQTIALTYGAITSFTTEGNNISFNNGTVNLSSGTDFNVTSGSGTITVGDITGSSNEQVILNSSGGSSSVVTVGTIGALGGIHAVNITGDTGVFLNGNITTANSADNDVRLTGPVVLAADVTIDTHNTDHAGDITFSATIDGSHTLTLDSGEGILSLGGMIGDTAKLNHVSLNTTAGITLSHDINTNGSNGVAVTANGITLNGLTVNTAENNGAITFDGAVTLATDDTVLNAGTGAVMFNDTVNGAQGLTVTGGDVTFGNHAGNSENLEHLIVNASGALSTALITTTGAIDLNSTTFAHSGTLSAGTTFTLTNSSLATISHDITSAEAMTFGGSGAVNLAADLSAGGLMSITPAVTLTESGETYTFTASDMDLTGSIITGDNTLVIAPTSGTAMNLGAGASGGFALTDTELNAIDFSSGTLTLGSALASDITLNNWTTSSDGALNILTGGTLTLASGQTADLSSASSVNLTAGDIDLAGTSLTVGSSNAIQIKQTANGTIELDGSGSGGADTLYLSVPELDKITAQEVTFGDASHNTINVAGAITPDFNTTLHGANVNVNDDITSSHATHADVTINGALTLNGSAINTVTGNGTIDINGAVTLASGASTLDAGTGTIDFDSTVDGAQDLGVTGGTISFNGIVGSTALSNLTVNASNDFTVSAAITATNAITLDVEDAVINAELTASTVNISQIDNNAMILGADGSDTDTLYLTDAELGNIAATTVNFGEADHATVNVTGAISPEFNSVLTADTVTVGSMITTGDASNANVTLTGTSGINWDGAILNTTSGNGDIDINGNVTLASSGTTLNAGSGTVDVSGTVTGAQDLSVTGGIITFNQNVDTANVTVNASGALSTALITTTGAIDFNATTFAHSGTLSAGTTFALTNSSLATISHDISSNGAMNFDGSAAVNLAADLSSGGLLSITPAVTLTGAGETRTLTASDMDLTGSITTGANTLVIAPTSGTAMNLGAGASGGFALDDAELNNIDFNSGTLTLGSALASDITLNNWTTSSDGVLNILTGGTLTLASGQTADLSSASSVSLTAGDIDLAGTSLTVGSSNAIQIKQTANGTIELGGSGSGGANTLYLRDAELDNITAQEVTFGDASHNTITVAGAITPDFNTTLHGANVNVNGDITTGDSSNGNITLTGAISLNATAINTEIVSGDIDINGAVTLGSGASSLTAGSGTIDFDSTVDGAQDLGVTGGTISFNGIVGSTALSNLTVNASNDFTVSAAITATNAITLDVEDAVINAVLTASTVNISQIDNASIILGSDGSDTDTLYLTDAELGNIAATTVNFGEADHATVNVTGAISPEFNSVLTADTVTVGSMITTGDASNANVTLTGTSGINWDGAILNTTSGNGDIDINGNVTLASSGTTLNAGSGTVDVSGTVTGAQDLSVTGGIITFNQNVDTANVTVNASGALSTALITTTGAIDLNSTTFAHSGTLSAGTTFALTNSSLATISHDITSAEAMTFGGSGAVNLAADLSSGGLLSITPAVTLTGADETRTLTASDMALTGSIITGDNTLVIAPTSGTAMNLGAGASGGFALTDTELNLIDSSTGTLQLGNADTGNITLNAWNTDSGEVGNLTVLTGGAITIADDATLDLSDATSVSFTTGTGNTDDFNLNLGSTLTATDTDVTINADDIELSGNAINMGTGTLLITQTDGALGAYALGTSGASVLIPDHTLHLTDTELDKITAGQVTIGSADNRGNLSVLGAITHNNNLSLIASSFGNINDGATLTTSGSKTLSIDSSTSSAIGNHLDAGGDLTLTGSAPIELAADLSAGGLMSITPAVTLTESGETYTFTASDMALTGSITTGDNTLVIAPTTGTAMNLGAGASGGFALDDVELNNIDFNSGTLTLGSALASDITLNNWTTSSDGALNILTGGTLTLASGQTADLSSASSVSLTAGDIDLAGTSLTVGSSNAIQIKQTANGTIELGVSGSGGADTLYLSVPELDKITAQEVTFGDASHNTITVAGAITPDFNTTLHGANVNVNDDITSSHATHADVTINGALTLNGSAINTVTGNGTIDINGAVTLASGASTLDAGTGTIDFDSTVDGAQDLGVTGGTISFNGIVGSTALSNLTVNASNDFTVSAAITATNAITLDVEDAVINAELTASTVNISQIDNASIILGSDGSDTDTLYLTDAELGNITATTVNFGEADHATVNVTGAISPGFNSVLTADTVTVGSMITTGDASNANVTLTGTSSINWDGAILNTTSGNGDIDINGNVTLASSGTTLNAGSGTVDVSGTVTGAQDLSVTGGIITFNQNVDTANVTVNASGALSTALITTTGAIDFNATTFAHSGTLSAGTTFALTNSSLATISHDITSAGAMTFDGTGTINLNANLQTTGESSILNISGPILNLTGSSTLTTNNGNITLDEVKTHASDSHILTLTAGTGSITFNDNIGVEGTELAGLNIQTGGAILFSGSGATVDVNTLTIGSSTAVGSVEFDGAVNVDGNIDINTGAFQNDAVITTGDSGTFELSTNDANINQGITSAGAMTFDGTGTINLNANLQTTEESSILNISGPILNLTGSSTLTTNNGNITLDEVNTSSPSAYTLTLTAGTGSITFDDNVGMDGVGELAGLDIQTGGAVHFSGTDATIAADALTIGSSTAVGSVEFDGTVNVDGNIDINTGTFQNDAVITAGGSGTFELNATGATHINQGITSTGAMTFGGSGAVNLAADLTSGGLLSITPAVTLTESGETRTLTASDMALTGSITTGDNTLVIAPISGTAMNLGVGASDDFALTDTELNLINSSTGTLQLGNASSGDITLSNWDTVLGQVGTLNIISGDSITLAGSATVDLSDATSVSFTTGSDDADSFTLNASSSLIAADRDITITADDIDLASDSSLNASTVFVEHVDGASGHYVLGATGSNSNTIYLTDSELDTLTADTLYIGSAANRGDVIVTGAITHGNNLSIQSSTFSGNDTITTTGSSTFNLNHSGTATLNADITSAGLMTLDGAGAIVLGGDVTLTASDLSLGTTITTGANTLVIAPTTGTAMNLGAGASGGFALTDTELNLIDSSTGTLQLGNASSGDITLSDWDTDSGEVGTLNIISGGSITLAGSATVDLSDATSVSFTTGSDSADEFTLSSGATLSATNTNVIITADDVDLSGTAIDLGTGTLSINHVDGGSGTFVLGDTGSGGNTIYLTDTELDKVNAGTLVIGGTTQGAIDILRDISPANVSTLSLKSGSRITADGAGVVVTHLAIEAGDHIRFAGSTTHVDTVAINTSDGNIRFDNDGALTVGSVDDITGITTTNGAITLNASDTITANENISATGGEIALEADSGNISVAAGRSIATTGDQNITLTARDFILNDTSGAALSAGNGAVILGAYDNGDFNLGADATLNTSSEISSDSLNQIAARTLQIGDGGSQIGAITVASDIAPVGVSILHLNTDSSVTATAGGINIGQLAIESGGAVEMTDASTDVGTLAVDTASGNITVVNSNALTIGTVGTLSGVDTDSGEISLTTSNGDLFIDQAINASSAITVSAIGNIDQNANITAGGATTIHADSDGNGTGDFDLDAGASLMTVGNSLELVANDVNIAGSINAGDTTLKVSDGGTIGLGDTAGDMTLTGAELGNITASSLTIGDHTNGTITVDNISADNSNNITGTLSLVATQDGAQVRFINNASIFNDLSVSAADGIDVNQNLTTNGITTFNADTDASDDNGTFTLASGATLDTTGNTLTITADGFTLDGAIDSGTATTTLRGSDSDAMTLSGDTDGVTAGLLVVDANTNGGSIEIGGSLNFTGADRVYLHSAGSVTNTDAHSISAQALAISAAGAVSLTGNNDVDTLAINTSSGAINFTDSDALTIGSVDIGGSNLAGLTASNDNITVTSGGLSISHHVNAGTGNVGLNVTGNITGESAGIIADTLGVTASGSVTLTGSNDVNTLAAEGGTHFNFTDSDDLIIGTVNSIEGIGSSSNPYSGNITLSTSGDLTFNQSVYTNGERITANAGTGNITVASDFELWASSSISLIGEDFNLVGGLNGSLVTSDVVIRSADNGAFDIEADSATHGDSENSEVSVGSLATINAGSLYIGTNASGEQVGDVTISADMNLTSVNAEAPENMTIESTGEVTSTNAITSDYLGVYADKGISLTGSNTIGSVTLEANDAITFTNTRDFNTVGSYNSTGFGIASLTAGDIIIDAGAGSIDVASGAGINTVSGNITLSAEDFNFAGAVRTNSGAESGSVTLFSNGGSAVNLGATPTDDNGVSEISKDSIDNITSGTLRIGNHTTRVGDVTVSANLDSLPGIVNIYSTGSVSSASSTVGGINTTSLGIEASGNVVLSAPSEVTSLGISAGGAVTFNDESALTIGSVSGINGLSAVGDINLTTNGNLAVNSLGLMTSDGSITIHTGSGDFSNTQQVSSGRGADDDITITTTDITFNNTIDVGSGTLSLTQYSNSSIDLGGTSAEMNISDIELNFITAGTLNIGDTDTAVTIGGAISPGSVTDLNIIGSSIALNHDVTTADISGNSVTFTGPVTVTGASTVSSNGINHDGDVTFTGTIEGSGDLTVDAGVANINISGVIGGTTALASLDLDAGNITLDSIGNAGTGAVGVTGSTDLNATGNITFNGATYQTNAVTYTATDFNVNAGVQTTFTTTNNAISFAGGSVRLADGSDFKVISGGGAITVGDIHGTSHEAVTLTSTGGAANTVSVGAIGSGDEVNTVAITGTSGVTLNGDITTGDQAGNTVTISGPVTLGADVSIVTDNTTNDGAVSFDSTLNGNHTLSIHSGSANTTFSGVIGGTTGLSGLDVNAKTISIGDVGDADTVGVAGTLSLGADFADDTHDTTQITYTGNTYKANEITAKANEHHLFSGSGDVTVTATGTGLSLGGASSGETGALTSAASSRTVTLSNTGGSVTVGGADDAGGHHIDTLNITSAGEVTIGSATQAANAIHITSMGTLGLGDADQTTDLSNTELGYLTAPTVTLEGTTLTADNMTSGLSGSTILISNTGDMTFSGGDSEFAGALTLDSAGNINLGASISTDSGDISTGDAIILTQTGNSITAGGSGSVTLSTVESESSSNHSLEVVTAGGNIQTGNLGAGESLGNITLNADSGNVVTGSINSAGSLDLTSGGFTHTGTITIAGAFELNNSDDITLSHDVTSGGITFSGTGGINLAADLTATGSLTFGDGLNIVADSTLSANRIVLNGEAGSVTGEGRLTLLPASTSEATTVTDLAGGGSIQFDNAVFEDFTGDLWIGAQSSASDSSTASITLDRALSSSGNIALVSSGDITLNAALSGEDITLIAEEGNITAADSSASISGSAIELGADGQIGTSSIPVSISGDSVQLWQAADTYYVNYSGPVNNTPGDTVLQFIPDAMGSSSAAVVIDGNTTGVSEASIMNASTVVIHEDIDNSVLGDATLTLEEGNPEYAPELLNYQQKMLDDDEDLWILPEEIRE